MSKQKNKRNTHKGKNNNIEIKHSRIQLCLTVIGLIIPIVSIVINVIMSNSQVDLEYIQNLPNLSISAEMSVDGDSDNGRLMCQVLNDGGNIREAELTPHLYLEYMILTQGLIPTDQIAVMEIADVFPAGYYFNNDGEYYSPDTIMYNAPEHSWSLEIEKDRLTEALNMLFLIGDPLLENCSDEIGLRATVGIYFEVSYIDIRGDERIEWYDASNILKLVHDDSESPVSFQMKRIDNNSDIPLHVYQNVSQSDRWIKIGEDLTMDRNMEAIANIVQTVKENLFNE